jgi:hypothetical protein
VAPILGYRPSIDSDPRLQQAAYITDGIDLYEVTGLRRGPGLMGATTVRIVVENCQNLCRRELLPEKIWGAFELVRSAPSAACPDLVQEIVW